MFNFRFIKQQVKFVVRPALILFAVLMLLTLTSLAMDSFNTFKVLNNQQRQQKNDGYVTVLTSIYSFSTYNMFLFIFSLILGYQLIVKEVHQGYMASWLTLPISRKTLLNSKLLLIIVTILAISCSELIMQLMLFTLRFKEFNSQAQKLLVLNNFTRLCLWILWTAIVWLIACTFSKSSTYFTIVCTLAAFFLFCAIYVNLHIFTGSGYNDWNKKPIQDRTLSEKIAIILQYFSITSLYNWVFIENKENTTKFLNQDYYPFNPIKTSHFVWQIPTMIVASTGLFIYGHYQFIRKDLAL